MRRTTIMLDEAQWLALRELAEREKRSPSEVIREAVATYVVERRAGNRPSFVGAAASGKAEHSQQAEEHLEEE
ncbi:MAG: ribbon-helix-helix protein, CopG family [Anaerolineae bacterium]